MFKTMIFLFQKHFFAPKCSTSKMFSVTSVITASVNSLKLTKLLVIDDLLRINVFFFFKNLLTLINFSILRQK